MVPMMAGLLASFSFTLLFSACSLIAGRAVDVVSRKTVTVGSCAVWSAMALGTAFTESFLQVFGLRVLQGSSQAFTVSVFSRGKETPHRKQSGRRVTYLNVFAFLHDFNADSVGFLS